MNQKYEDIFIGVVFAIVSGMMCLIAVQVWDVILFIEKPFISNGGKHR
jgi:hypothetical protein